MAEHRIRLTWNDGGKPFTYEAYPREQQIAFFADMVKRADIRID